MTTEIAPLTLADIDLGDEQLFESGRAHEAFKVLRRENPISWRPEDEYSRGWWNMVRYADVLQVSRNPQIFSSEKGIVSFFPVNEDETTAAAAGNGKMLITMDPPRHVKLRRLVNKGFTPRAVGAMEPMFREVTKELLDNIAKKGECDFVLEVASQLPLAFICGMMGLERSVWPLMFELTNKVLGAGDPEYQTDVPEEQRGTEEAARITGNMGVMQMFGFFAQELQKRRANPGGTDLISIICDSEVDGEKLSDEDVLWFCFLLILAGNETTRNAISGGLKALCENPDQKAKLLADMALIDSAVEEICRWVSPLHHMSRTCVQDTEIGGQPIKAGDKVLMWYLSANRDEEIFTDPYTFDITRTPNDHLAFGIGEHFCLGAGFARKELKVMFQELFRRFPDIELDGEGERLRSNFINGIKHLPVRFTPEA